MVNIPNQNNLLKITEESFYLHYPASLEKFAKELFAYINMKKNDIFNFFDIENFEKVYITLFEDKDTYLNIKNDNSNAINFYINKEDKNDKELYDYNINMIVNQFVKLVYNNQINSYINCVWLKEGLASFFSGEKAYMDDEVEFKSWFLRNIIRRDKIIPDIKSLKNYDEFCDSETDKYNGYDLSYLVVRYLFNILNKEKLLTIIKNTTLIEELESSLLKDAINYYTKMFPVKDNFSDIKTPTELLDYMNKNILYGWVDCHGNKQINNMKNFRKLYRTSSVQDTINNNLGTCIEQTRLEKELLDRLNIPCKMFALRSYDLENSFDDQVKMHCFLLFEYNNKCYHFEHSNPLIPGIHKYANEEAAIRSITKYYQNRDKGKTRRLNEFNEVREGLSFKEFNEYLNNKYTKKLQIK